MAGFQLLYRLRRLRVRHGVAGVGYGRCFESNRARQRSGLHVERGRDECRGYILGNSACGRDQPWALFDVIDKYNAESACGFNQRRTGVFRPGPLSGEWRTVVLASVRYHQHQCIPRTPGAAGIPNRAIRGKKSRGEKQTETETIASNREEGHSRDDPAVPSLSFRVGLPASHDGNPSNNTAVSTATVDSETW